ncbi:hypothetical protein D9M68_793580 [compost metagenome]
MGFVVRGNDHGQRRRKGRGRRHQRANRAENIEHQEQHGQEHEDARPRAAEQGHLPHIAHQRQVEPIDKNRDGVGDGHGDGEAQHVKSALALARGHGNAGRHAAVVEQL